jgi:hypothetical protein
MIAAKANSYRLRLWDIVFHPQTEIIVHTHTNAIHFMRVKIGPNRVGDSQKLAV